jgi:hypothetical protein
LRDILSAFCRRKNSGGTQRQAPRGERTLLAPAFVVIMKKEIFP